MPFKIGRKHKPETIEKMKLDGRKGRKHTELSKKKMSEWQKGIRHSIKTEFKKGIIPWNKGKKGLWQWPKEIREKLCGSRKGNRNGNWKGGVTPLHLIIRTSKEYRIWREAVFKRDNYSCVWCGISGSKAYLQADHIKTFADYPELRFALDNGRTLCINCHKKTDTYARNQSRKKTLGNNPA